MSIRGLKRTIFAGWLAAVSIFTNAVPALSKDSVEVDAGSGFIASADGFFSGTGRAYATHWVDLKIRPFADQFQMQAVGLQVGTHQTQEMSQNIACRVAPSIAGRNFCSTSGSNYSAGLRFMAVYGGVHAEMVELMAREPKLLQIYLGAGASAVRSILAQGPLVAPYSSIEIGYQVQKKLSAKAGLFMSMYDVAGALGIAAPSISFEYKF